MASGWCTGHGKRGKQGRQGRQGRHGWLSWGRTHSTTATFSLFRNAAGERGRMTGGGHAVPKRSGGSPGNVLVSPGALGLRFPMFRTADVLGLRFPTFRRLRCSRSTPVQRIASRVCSVYHGQNDTCRLCHQECSGFIACFNKSNAATRRFYRN